MILEVVVLTAGEAAQAKEAGADRVEVISGGPSQAATARLGALAEIRENGEIPAFSFMKPHPFGFVYSDEEIREIAADIQSQRRVALGFVLGCLTAEGRVHQEHLERLLEAAGDVPVTFHKAIDLVADYDAAVETIAQYAQVKRVLTNFQAKCIPQEQERIARMVCRLRDAGLETTFSGGVNLETFPILLAAGVREIHLSSGARDGGGRLSPEQIGRYDALRRAFERDGAAL